MDLKDVLGRVREKLLSWSNDDTSPPVEAAIRCHQGKIREENQDRAASFTTPLGKIFLVADGVGGLSSGAEAAEMTVTGYGEFLHSVKRNMDPSVSLYKATQAVNQAICDHSLATQQSMGSTIALVLLQRKTAYLGHAGDSRVYLIRGGAMSRLTRDHSIVQKMVDHGIISDAQSRSHPDASVLTRSLGQKGVELEQSEVELHDGDALLLCSDGLWGYVDENQIQAGACSSSFSAEKIVDELVHLALQAGGADNISVIFVRLSPA